MIYEYSEREDVGELNKSPCLSLEEGEEGR